LALLEPIEATIPASSAQAIAAAAATGRPARQLRADAAAHHASRTMHSGDWMYRRWWRQPYPQGDAAVQLNVSAAPP